MTEKSLSEIAQYINAQVDGDASLKVNSFAPIENATTGQLSFIASDKYAHFLYTSKATAILINRNFVATKPFTASLLRVDDPYLALAKLMQLAEAENSNSKKGIAQTAVIAPSVKIPQSCYIGEYVVIERNVTIAENVTIEAYCYLGEGCKVGKNTKLYPRVTLYNDVVVGEECIIHAGAVIGADGFGFAPSATGYSKIPQLGNVTIGNNVEIGANTTIDRAVMGSTTIGNGVKIDNLVQVGHNCKIGSNTVVSAQTGFAGTTTIGSWCRIGGQAGFAGHQVIGDNTQVGAQTGVVGNVDANAKILGSPQIPVSKALRAYTIFPKLPELEQRIKKLEAENNIKE